MITNTGIYFFLFSFFFFLFQDRARTASKACGTSSARLDRAPQSTPRGKSRVLFVPRALPTALTIETA